MKERPILFSVTTGQPSQRGKQEAFLQLDHVENDGHLDRKAHKTSAKLFAVLKRLGWPRDRYQLLCANCNFGKAMNGGVCPHQSQEARCA